MPKFTPIDSEDTQELRKNLDLPITKELRYMTKSEEIWKEHKVLGYHIVTEYLPSKTKSLVISVELLGVIRILAPYFSHMQKPSFVEDMETQIESL